MPRIRWFLFLSLWLAFPAQGAAPVIPEPLRPWVDWVLQDHRDYRCPFIYNSFGVKRCSWPSRMKLDLQAQKGRFQLDLSVYAESWTQLPGDAKFWPQQVTAGRKPIPVLERNGYPALLLEPGNYRIDGEFYWDALPESLAVPQDSGLLEVTVEGRPVPLPALKDGQLWIKQTGLQAGAPQSVENKAELQVYRRIVDDVPLQIITRIDIDVSGMQREITLPSPLLPGFIPLQLQSPIPARLEPGGQLLLQVRPGHWQVEITARHPQQLRELALNKIAAPWPEAEIWVFDARPYQRVVEIKNLPAIDPQQTNLPDDWRALPAYRVNQGDIMQFTQVRRGDSDPEPNKLSLQRRLWLDFDGHGYTVNDRIAGTMTQGRRLSAAPEMQLGQVALDGESQLVTRLPGDGQQGVEVRRGRIDLSADSRLSAPVSRLSATGWQQQFQHVSAELNLPPGWRLLGANGVDNVPDSWVSRWTLLDLFVVLIAALAIGRLWDYRWGLLALAALGLIWHEPDAPRFVWLHILAASALLRVLPAGKFAVFVKLYRSAFWLGLVLLAVPFIVAQIRTGLYPQLEDIYRPIQPMRYEQALSKAPLPAAPPAEMQAEMMLRDQAGTVPEAAPAARLRSLEGRGTAGGVNAAAEKPVNFDRIDPNANVQTGPGLPQWQWKTVPLSWNGPVGSEQQIRLWLLSPTLTLLLNLVRVMLVTMLALLMFGVLKGDAENNGKWPPMFRWFQHKPRINWPPMLLAILLLTFTLWPFDPAYADYPDQAMLEALKQRLLKAPECTPQCAQISLLQLRIDNTNLRIDMQAHSQENTAVPLPAQAEQWFPNYVAIDGRSAGLYRDAQGGLWLALPEGRHNIAMQGRVAMLNKFSLPLPLQPRRVTVTAREWQVDGVHEHGTADAQLQFTRITFEAAPETPEALLEPSILPAFASVERTLQLGVDWHVQTRVIRQSPPAAAIVLEVPLLPGEAVTTPDIHVKDGKVAVNMPPEQSELVWDSVLAKTEHLDFTAAVSDVWAEVWRADVSPMWHMQIDGLAAVHQPDPQGPWLPEWRPWPGEKLKLSITRPEAVPGQTLTIDKSYLRVNPSSRSLEAWLELQLRSSKGGQYALYLPEDAALQSVAIDGALQPISLKNRQLLIPIRPGAQSVQITWRQNHSLAPLLRTPAVNLGNDSVNSHVQVNLGQDRWTLFTGGPDFGPAVLFWGVLAVLAMLAYGLGQLGYTPLRPWQWFLLLTGLSQIPMVSAAVVIGWLLALGWRAERLRPDARSRWFQAVQIGLALLTLASLALLFTAVEHGLLGAPDMQIAGNNSTPYQLNWYQDRNEAALPVATAVTVPLFVYRLLMLAWSLWLAISLLNWLKWGWSCFSRGGLWKRPAPLDQAREPAHKGSVSIQNENSVKQEDLHEKNGRELRKAVRYRRADLKGELKSTDLFDTSQFFDIKLIDISTRGAGIFSIRKLLINHAYTLKVTFSDDKTFLITGKVISSHFEREDCYGFNFDSVNDELGEHLLKSQNELKFN